MLPLLRRSSVLSFSASCRPFPCIVASPFIYRTRVPLLESMAAKRKRTAATAAAVTTNTNPQANPEVIDAPDALRASPDSDVDKRLAPGVVKGEDSADESPLSDVPDVAVEPPSKKKRGAAVGGKKGAATNGSTARAAPAAAITPTKATPANKAKENADMVDPEAEGEEDADEEEMMDALSRAPPVNSNYLPLPWKGRLGYVSGPAFCFVCFRPADTTF